MIRGICIASDVEIHVTGWSTKHCASYSKLISDWLTMSRFACFHQYLQLKIYDAGYQIKMLFNSCLTYIFLIKNNCPCDK